MGSARREGERAGHAVAQPGLGVHGQGGLPDRWMRPDDENGEQDESDQRDREGDKRSALDRHETRHRPEDRLRDQRGREHAPCPSDRAAEPQPATERAERRTDRGDRRFERRVGGADRIPRHEPGGDLGTGAPAPKERGSRDHAPASGETGGSVAGSDVCVSVAAVLSAPTVSPAVAPA